MKYAKILSVFFILLAIGCSHLNFLKNTRKVSLTGLAKHNKLPLPSAKINIYNVHSMSLVKSITADEKGYFKIDLPEGGYYVLGSKNENEENFFAYLGNNPVYLSNFAGELNLVLDYIKIPPKDCCSYEKEPTASGSIIAGTVMFEDKPVENAQVYFFSKFFDEIRLKGRGAKIETTDDKGDFLAELNEDEYYIIARKRFNAQIAGPLQEGDLFGYYHMNPLKLRQGEKHVIKIFTDKKKGNITSGTYFSSNNGIVPLNETVISGKVYDLNKKPVKGMYVFLTDTPELVERPAYFSNPTKEDGSYEIHLGGGGLFFIAAKEKLGEVVKPGTKFGNYDENVNRYLEIKKGIKLENINLTVEEIQ